MAKILFYAHDPGGANAVKPLIEPLKKEGHRVYIYGDGNALNIIPNIMQFSGDTDKLISDIMPDFIITGTSASDLTEKEIRKSAKKARIKSLSVLDHWLNYGVRFTKYSVLELDKYNNDRNFEYLPDYIVVMDEYAKSEMAKEGIPSDIIYPLGNPHFEEIKTQLDNLDCTKLREKYLKGKEKIVVFASQCFIEDKGFGEELNAIKDISEVLPDDVQFYIKPHPREKKDKFKDFNIELLNNITSQEAVKISNIVISINSMVLIESLIAGVKSISYQRGEKGKNHFILTKIGALPFINDKMGLEEEIQKKLNSDYVENNFKFNLGAKDKIIKFIKEQL